MKIRSVLTSGFRGLADKTYDLSDVRTGKAADLVFVTGPSASGKTSFLEAIVAGKEAVAPYGSRRPPAEYLRKGELSAKVRIGWTLSAVELERVGGLAADVFSEAIFTDNPAMNVVPNDSTLMAVLGEYDRRADVGKVEYFHATRRLGSTGARSIAASSNDAVDRMIRLGREDAKYSMLPAYLVDASLGIDRPGEAASAAPGKDRFAKAFARLCTTKRFAGAARVDGVVAPRFVDDAGHTYGVTELAEAERQAVLFAATFCRAEIHGSVVLVDTPELHVGSADVKAFVAGIASLGEGNQIIVATGSREALEVDSAAPVVRLGRPA